MHCYIPNNQYFCQLSMPWKYNITVNIDPSSRNQGINLCSHYLLALWVFACRAARLKIPTAAVPWDWCFWHSLLPCLITNMDMSTSISVHTWPADIVHRASFQPSADAGCSKAATGGIQRQQPGIGGVEGGAVLRDAACAPLQVWHAVPYP